jgi:hypothetical protein
MIDLLNQDSTEPTIFLSDDGLIYVGYSPDHSSSWIFNKSDSEKILNAMDYQKKHLVQLWKENDGEFILFRCGITD